MKIYISGKARKEGEKSSFFVMLTNKKWKNFELPIDKVGKKSYFYTNPVGG